MELLILIVVLTIAISAGCSLLEATLYCCRMPALETAKGKGPHSAQAAKVLEMKKDISGPTAAILILNTTANVFGTSIAASHAATLPDPHNYLAWGLPISLTLGILFFSEILPKVYGAVHWKELWPYIVIPLVLLQRILRPMIWVIQHLTSLFAHKEPDLFNEEELIGMARLGVLTGGISAAELVFFERALAFDDIRTRQIMVPRIEVISLDPREPFSETVGLIRKTKHTRYPLCAGTLENLQGLIHIKDLVGLAQASTPDLRKLARPMDCVSENEPVHKVLRKMQLQRQHMAAVVDEHGAVVGIVTLESILEQLVGEVQDEFDNESPEWTALGGMEFAAAGRMPLTRLRELLGLELPDSRVHTLSGLLVAQAGRLLEQGEVVKLPGLEATILEAKRGRAIRVKLKVLQEEAGAPPPSGSVG